MPFRADASDDIEGAEVRGEGVRGEGDNGAAN